MLVWSIFEVMGTVAFAASGAMLGIKKQFDIFGIFILSATTAIGGGIIRDTMIGNTPPLAFQNPEFILITLITTLVVCIAYKQVSKVSNFLLIIDAIGLGAFTATGVSLATERLDTVVLCVVMGVTTGIGGGILRDLLAKEIPLVFHKEIYAVASILGAVIQYYSQYWCSKNIGIYLCFIVTITVRLVSIYYDIQLPKVAVNNDEEV